MTTHRHDEAISFVSWFDAGPLHIRRPRSQKGVAYCWARVIETKRLPLVRDFTIDHPDEIPLEIRIERDFANLCPGCARMFFNEVAEENGTLRWSGVLVSVPIAWQAIYVRTGRSPWIQEKIENERLDLMIEDREEAGL